MTIKTLYHYCSSTEFASIINNGAIWLSSLTLSNDFLEGKLISNILSELLKKEDLDEKTFIELREAVFFFDQFIDGLGFCLSEDGDLLSQWRGYANDGKGFSIGFSKEYLEMLENQFSSKEPKLRKVIYDPSEHLEIVLPIYEKIRSHIQSGVLLPSESLGLMTMISPPEIATEKYREAWREIYSSIVVLLPQLFSLKNQAFSEEEEWRLISHIIKDKYGEDVLFRAGQNKIIPYKEIRFLPLSARPILEIIIGPKNITPEFVVEGFLKQKDYDNVIVKRSRASYQ
ncbi:MAG: hypothetical protein DRH03_00725 [Deltaproteobacteria bacterium]|nr:MAG: hypothetical protein DRH03_00725 [Deltaproteobacteria bacterium]